MTTPTDKTDALIRKLAAHVRPTCSELYDEAMQALAEQPAETPDEARQDGDYAKANALVRARVTLYRAIARPAATAVVSDGMVERAEAAATEYWQDEIHATRCDKCNGTGEDRSVPDWCGACGGQGHYHAGTESGAMRAALTAALNPEPKS